MTNQTIEQAVAEMPTNKCPLCDGDGCTVESDQDDPTGQTPIQVQCDFCHAEGKITTLDCVTHTLTADRLALLTELREWTENYLKKVNKYAESCHEENLIMLAYDAHSREIAIEHFKAQLDELINSTK